jgi:hypothetical protein
LGSQLRFKEARPSAAPAAVEPATVPEPVDVAIVEPEGVSVAGPPIAEPAIAEVAGRSQLALPPAASPIVEYRGSHLERSYGRIYSDTVIPWLAAELSHPRERGPADEVRAASFEEPAGVPLDPLPAEPATAEAVVPSWEKVGPTPAAPEIKPEPKRARVKRLPKPGDQISPR